MSLRTISHIATKIVYFNKTLIIKKKLYNIYVNCNNLLHGCLIERLSDVSVLLSLFSKSIIIFLP